MVMALLRKGMIGASLKMRAAACSSMSADLRLGLRAGLERAGPSSVGQARAGSRPRAFGLRGLTARRRHWLARRARQSGAVPSPPLTRKALPTPCVFILAVRADRNVDPTTQEAREEHARDGRLNEKYQTRHYRRISRRGLPAKRRPSGSADGEANYRAGDHADTQPAWRARRGARVAGNPAR
jgi:hypothetical protein